MRDRILALLEAEKISPAKFAEQLGVQRSGISHILSGRNQPSLDMLYKILSKFPQLSAEWLLRGNGKMYLNVSLDSYTIHVEQPRETADPQANQRQQPMVDKESTKSTPDDQAIESSPLQGTEINQQKRAQTIDSNQIVIFYPDHTFELFHPRN